jgi:hypothetical protein
MLLSKWTRRSQEPKVAIRKLIDQTLPDLVKAVHKEDVQDLKPLKKAELIHSKLRELVT